MRMIRLIIYPIIFIVFGCNNEMIDFKKITLNEINLYMQENIDSLIICYKSKIEIDNKLLSIIKKELNMIKSDYYNLILKNRYLDIEKEFYNSYKNYFAITFLLSKIPYLLGEYSYSIEEKMRNLIITENINIEECNKFDSMDEFFERIEKLIHSIDHDYDFDINNPDWSNC